MKNNDGVTLVALVVTIIVLIILAGVSINLTLGDNGIITIAKRAKENTELAKIQEEKELNELYTQLVSENPNSENLPYDSITKLTEFNSTHITGCNSDITIDVSNYSTFSFTLTVLHPYVNMYITADGTNIYKKLASADYTGETKTFDVSNVEKIRIYNTPHSSYVEKGYQLNITLK